MYGNERLGTLTFNEKKGIGDFTYALISRKIERLDIKPSTLVTLLEEIRADAKDMKTVGELERYVNSKFGKFKFVNAED